MTSNRFEATKHKVKSRKECSDRLFYAKAHAGASCMLYDHTTNQPGRYESLQNCINGNKEVLELVNECSKYRSKK